MRRLSDFQKFRKYLIANKPPFPCPYLRVLSEDIIATEGKEDFKYKEGELICTQAPGSIGNVRDHRCHVTGSVLINDKGNLEVLCGWLHNKLEINVTDFEFNKK